MSEEKKEEEGKDGKKKSRGGGSAIMIAIVVVVGLGAGVSGTFLGQMLTGGAANAASGHGDPKAHAEGVHKGKGEGEGSHGPPRADVPVKKVMEFKPMVVDVWTTGKDNPTMHHVKVGIVCEVNEHMEEEEWKLYMPRGREAAISYLRGQTFERLTSSKEFEKVKEELRKSVEDVLGRHRVLRVLITDFVTQ